MFFHPGRHNRRIRGVHDAAGAAAGSHQPVAARRKPAGQDGRPGAQR